MIDDLEFKNLICSFEQFSDECEKAKADRASSETLIASAEYELELLKKLFAGARLEPGAMPKSSSVMAQAPDEAPVAPEAEPRTETAAPAPMAA